MVDQSCGAYSALSSVDKDSVGIFYESSQALLLYQRLTVEELAE
jgi:hypothetical protein